MAIAMIAFLQCFLPISKAPYFAIDAALFGDDIDVGAKPAPSSQPVSFPSTSSSSTTSSSCQHQQHLPDHTHDTSPAIVTVNGKRVEISSFPSSIVRGYNVTTVSAEKKLHYVHSFLSSREATAMSSFCDEISGSQPSRFQRSPQTGVGDAQGPGNAARTSLSCPLFFSYFYMPRINQLRAKSESMADELQLTWDVTLRASDLLGYHPSHFEPFQLLRYGPGEYYKRHHDHRGYYDTTGGYPDRPVTLLLFLNDVTEDAGGGLAFDQLGLTFQPKEGDAIAWSNVDTDGLADPDMVHEAMPLAEGGHKMAVNVWVRDKAFTDPSQAAMRQH